MFRSQKALAALLLTLTLLVAPAALAAPDADVPDARSISAETSPAQTSWMLWIQDLLADLFGLPSLEAQAESGTDDTTDDDGEIGSVVQPNG